MQIFTKTDVGKSRVDNQDAFLAGKLSEDTAFAVVCDGMGGANAGKLASETGVKLISDYIIKSFRKNMDSEKIIKMLRNSIVNANIVIYDMSLKNPELAGMGTTAVAAVVNKNAAVIAHVGDSRAYLIGDNITQLTRDHSVVQSLIESGKLSPEEAKSHPRKNVITRAIGAEEEVNADCCEISLKEGESVLICTDGLTNFIETQDIYRIFKNTEINGVANALVNLANDNGGQDNITVVTLTR
ncbi:MAG: Stp1/IreP family PP2C-type Ser/Thr phosphatase [Clostridia bacterium]|nr:Stp1/IreP family PP2C-type Ser/Thr phosphatase [Clostridia bacterium]